MFACSIESSVDIAAAVAPARIAPVSQGGAYAKSISGKIRSGIAMSGMTSAPPRPTSAAGM